MIFKESCGFTHNQNLNKKEKNTRTFRAVVYCVSAKFSDVVNSNGPKYFFARIFKEYCLEVEKDPVKFKESCGFTHDQNLNKK